MSIPSVALDDVVSKKNCRIFIKVDIEGHELAAIEGMRDMLMENSIFLQVESFENNQQRLHADLERVGMRFVHAIRDDLFFSNFPD